MKATQRHQFFRPRTLAGQQSLIGYIFISPFILGFLLWYCIPALVSIWLTFQDWNMITPARFVGLDNVGRLFDDPLFTQSLKVATTYTIVAVPLGLGLSFLVALLINMKVPGISIFRTIFYMPSIVPSVANAMLWSWILNSEFGLLNVLLDSIGLPKIRWLLEPQWALPALIIMSLWALGGSMVIFLAGLQGIPDIYYEAAAIDGAGRWDMLLHITLPLMSPVLLFNLVMGIIGSFQVFTAGFLVTNGGPENSTLFYMLRLHRTGFQFFEMGYAATLAWVLFSIILGLTLLVFKYVGSMVYYEDAR